MARRCGRFHGNVMIERIVSRLHVGTPPDEAVAYAKSRLAPGAWNSLSAADQRNFDCEVRRSLAAGLDDYRFVMRGGR